MVSFIKEMFRKFLPAEKNKGELLSPNYYKSLDDIRALFGELDFRDGRQMYAVIGMDRTKRHSRLIQYLDALKEESILSKWEYAGLQVLVDQLVREAWSQRKGLIPQSAVKRHSGKAAQEAQMELGLDE